MIKTNGYQIRNLPPTQLLSPRYGVRKLNTIGARRQFINRHVFSRRSERRSEHYRVARVAEGGMLCSHHACPSVLIRRLTSTWKHSSDRFNETPPLCSGIPIFTRCSTCPNCRYSGKSTTACETKVSVHLTRNSAKCWLAMPCLRRGHRISLLAFMDSAISISNYQELHITYCLSRLQGLVTRAELSLRTNVAD